MHLVQLNSHQKSQESSTLNLSSPNPNLSNVVVQQNYGCQTSFPLSLLFSLNLHSNYFSKKIWLANPLWEIAIRMQNVEFTSSLCSSKLFEAPSRWFGMQLFLILIGVLFAPNSQLFLLLVHNSSYYCYATPLGLG
jgi:hypothetical protein